MAAALSITEIKLSLGRQFTTYGLFYLSPNQSRDFEAKGFVYVYNSYQSNGWYVLWVDKGGVSVIRQLGEILPFSASYSDGKITITNNQTNNRGYVLACQNLEIVETS